MVDENGGREAIASMRHRGAVWLRAEDVVRWLEDVPEANFSTVAKGRLIAGASTTAEITAGNVTRAENDR